MSDTAWSRREILQLLTGLGFGGLACGPVPAPGPEALLPPSIPRPVARASYESNLRALLDTLVPRKVASDGSLLRPGALDLGAERLLQVERLTDLLENLGLIHPSVEDRDLERPGFDRALQNLIEVQLDVLAGRHYPLEVFRDLPQDVRERLVEEGFADRGLEPILQFVRAGAFIAYLGAIYSDAGLIAVGFPPFEDFSAGVAVSGYPRMVDGEVEDYSYNEAPAASPPLEPGLIDSNGDLI